MAENINVSPENVNSAKTYLTGSSVDVTGSATKANAIAGRQGTHKWTGLNETAGTRTATESYMRELAARMREAAEAADLYCDYVQQTHDDFDATDEAGQAVMVSKYEAMTEIFSDYQASAQLPTAFAEQLNSLRQNPLLNAMLPNVSAHGAWSAVNAAAMSSNE